MIARLLAGPTAGRLSPDRWATAEAQRLRPHSKLRSWGAQLEPHLDQDGAEPDEREPAEVNELSPTRRPTAWADLKARFDNAAWRRCASSNAASLTSSTEHYSPTPAQPSTWPPIDRGAKDSPTPSGVSANHA